eukprot:g32364.t1
MVGRGSVFGVRRSSPSRGEERMEAKMENMEEKMEVLMEEKMEEERSKVLYPPVQDVYVFRQRGKQHFNHEVERCK